jgi:tryptophan synthase alpha chain
MTFERLRKKGHAALIPFIVAGDPDFETTEALIPRLVQSGANIIELGVPFSDPLADGPTIQTASQRALQNGADLEKIFRLTKKFDGVPIPFVLMTYFNPVFKFGVRDFAKECRANRIDGVIIPDLPIEEAATWVREARAFHLDTIFLVTPTTPPERIKRITRWSRGFIYYVSVTGVTGLRGTLPHGLELAVSQIKGVTQKPLAVGFGISTPEQARNLSLFADGVIVGSAIVKIIGENLKRPELTTQVGNFVASLAEVLR